MEGDDDVTVEPIPDIVERLKFYSRDPQQPATAAPNEPAVEDEASPSRTTDVD
jgi:hypothetical protein